MGYKVPRRQALIRFEGTDYDGAEITCVLDVDLDIFFTVSRAAGGDVGAIEAALRAFAQRSLLSWNIEDDDGTPIVASEAAFMALPPAMGLLIITRWLEAAATPGPLSATAPSGGGS